MKRCPKCGKTFADEANFCPTDAGRLVNVAAEVGAAALPTPAATDRVAGQVGGRYELGPIIGGDSTGEVHRGIDGQNGQAVAVKLVAPAVLAIPQVAQRIDRELKLLERVEHKGVARVLASGKYGDREFVVTELVEGARPLQELIGATGPIDPQRASDLVLAIGEALIEAAKVGVVHRDLAPKNVLITQDSLRLINFAVPTPGDQTTKIAGVPEFVAPEAIEGKPVDQRGNIYSLGAIYYFLLTGRAPHVGDPATVMAAHLAGAVDAPSRHAAVPADVDALILRSLERNAAKRFLTLRQFLDEVERVAHGPAGGLHQTAPFGRANKKSELSSTLMGFGGVNKEALTAKTKAMSVQVPPEALRDDVPRVASPPAAVTAPLQAQPGAAGRPGGGHDAFAPAAAAMYQAAPAIGAAAGGAGPGQPGQPVRSDAFAPAAAAMQQAAPAMGAAGGGARHDAFAPAAAAMQHAAPAIGAAGGAAAESPWGRPGQAGHPTPGHDPYAPAAAAMQQAAPGMGAAATVAAPAAPKVPAGATGKKKGEEQKGSKGKFRETMWFKKGEMDAKAAEEAAATGDAAATDKADLMPIEERYGDDGTITRGDAEKYSLKTGATSMMAAVREDGATAGVSERELVGEMKGGRNKVLIVIALVVLALAGIIAAFLV